MRGGRGVSGERTIEKVVNPRCPSCDGKGQIEIHTISNDTCDGKPAHSVRHRKCRRCDGHGQLPPSNPEPSEQGIGWPEGAEPLGWESSSQ